MSVLPKPILFGVFGALGCLGGGILGEPLLLLLRFPSQGSDSAAIAPVLVFNTEFNRRLEREGAKSGDVQLSLMWNNYNDLDLHCIDPRGEEIFYRHKRSRSRGELDVDMNAGGRQSNKPVENIYWPKGKAPTGKYRVFVNHFKNQGDADPTVFTVGVTEHGRSQEFSGQISSGEPKRLIYEFDVSVPPQDTLDSSFKRSVLVIGFWTALLAIGLSFALVVGQNSVLRRALVTKRQGILLTIGALIAGTVSGSASQLLFTFVAQVHFLLTAGQVLGWALLGSLLGLGMAMFIPNLQRRSATIAGAVGGFIGAIAFLSGANTLGELAGRLLGAVVLGFCIGLMVALVEQLAREASLIVHWNAKEKSIINLGEIPVVLGSSSESHVYLPKEKGFLPTTALVTFRNGRIEIDNKMTNSKQTLHNGSKLQMGNLLIEIKAAK